MPGDGWPDRVTWAEVRAADPRVFRKAALGGLLLIPAAGFGVLLAAFAGEFIAPLALPAWLDWAPGLLTVTAVWAMILLGVFAVVLLAAPAELRRELALRAFAEARGLRYARIGSEPPARGIFFAEGQDSAARLQARERLRRGTPRPGSPPPGSDTRFRANFSLEVAGDAWEPDLQVAVAGYTGGKNDPKGPALAFRYLQLRLPRPVPHLMIDALGNGRLRNTLPGTLRVSLEGDFDRYFAVYAPDGYQRDARELLTPDVMASLIDRGRHWDIEVVEDRMIVVSNKVRARSDRAEITALLRFADLVGAELAHQVVTYSDPRASRPRVRVADAGLRLRRSVSWSWVIVPVAVGVLLGFPFVLGWILDHT